MSRNIKFRVWNKATKTMHLPDWYELAIRANLPEMELMQFTGLFDKIILVLFYICFAFFGWCISQNLTWWICPLPFISLAIFWIITIYILKKEFDWFNFN